jgi:hypothetical protein
MMTKRGWWQQTPAPHLWATAHRVDCRCSLQNWQWAQWQTPKVGPTTTMQQYITCPQPHEQLLMGWIAGGMMTTQWQWQQWMTMTTNNKQWQWMTMRVAGQRSWQQGQDNEDPRTTTMDSTPNRHHGQLLVEMGCNEDGDNKKAPPPSLAADVGRGGFSFCSRWWQARYPPSLAITMGVVPYCI